MALLPLGLDPTLEAADRALVEREAQQPARPYLGASWAGEPCSRRLWSRFRWLCKELADAATIRRWHDGHAGEAMQAERLRRVPGVVLETLNAITGQQHEVVAAGGHLRGHLDGIVHGLLQAPKTPHVWEHKQVGQKELDRLRQLKVMHGEKGALREWKPVYYVQAQLYMHLGGFARHYMTVASPGGRETVSLRTELDKAAAQAALDRAVTVINSARPPSKLDAADFECKWCPFRSQCHEDAAAERNCRTCLHSTPEPDGRWSCARFVKLLTADEQRAGCPSHRYIPDLVPGEQVDAAPDGAWVEYRMKDGTAWKDAGP